MKTTIIHLIIFILLFSGCASQKQTVIEEQPEVEIKVPVLEKGRELLALPAENLFFSALAQYKVTDPADAEQLLEEYKEKQEKFFIHALENEQYSDSWFYYNNLLAFDKPDEEKIDGFFDYLITNYENTGYEGTSRYLSLMLGNEIEEQESPFKRITSYQDILVEIYVNRIYEDKYKIERKNNSFGSGFLINNTQIITAFHILESCFAVNTKNYTIYIKKDDKIINKIIIKGWDSLTDIALLEMKDEEFKMPEDFLTLLGNSSKLKQGDEIYCLGHHSGLTSTLTKGIVSATERHAPEVGTWIQIDANVTPGASGGIAIGVDRKIYGMIVAGVAFEDLNFIVPSNLILSVIDRLSNGKQIKRPWIGLLLEEYWNKKGDITIADVFPTSPLHMYNARRGDKLLEINNQPVESIKQAQEIINGLFAGNLVHIKIKSNSGEKDCWVLLERRPDYPIYNATLDYNKLSSLYPHFGFAVDDDNIIRKNISFKGSVIYLNFYKILHIRPFSVLDNKGVKTGDTIGFLSDYFINRTRYIDVLHIPENKNLDKIDNIDIYDFIYELEKGAYDENIL